MKYDNLQLNNGQDILFGLIDVRLNAFEAYTTINKPNADNIFALFSSPNDNIMKSFTENY